MVENVRNELYLEEFEEQARRKEREEMEKRERQKQELLAAKEYQERLKQERKAEELRMEDEFKTKLMQKFAEDERIEQMNAQKRRMKELEHKRRVIEELEKKNVKDLQGRAKSLEGVDLSFEMQASEEGKLFGSVTNSDIAGRFAEQGIQVDRRKIVLGEPIKSVGEHEVTVRLHRDVAVPLKVTVVSIGAPAQAVEEDVIDETALPEPTED